MCIRHVGRQQQPLFPTSGVRAAATRVTTVAGRTMPCSREQTSASSFRIIDQPCQQPVAVRFCSGAQPALSGQSSMSVLTLQQEVSALVWSVTHLDDEHPLQGLEHTDTGQGGRHQRHVARRGRRQLRLLAQCQEQAPGPAGMGWWGGVRGCRGSGMPTSMLGGLASTANTMAQQPCCAFRNHVPSCLYDTPASCAQAGTLLAPT